MRLAEEFAHELAHGLGSLRHTARIAQLMVAVLLLGLGTACAKKAPELTAFEEIPSAETLYRQGLEELDKEKMLGILPTADFQKAIDTFQSIVDNYPYSDYAVLAELKIADAYYQQEKWEEALSYYRDFAELHPSHERVPYSVYRSALCRFNQSRSANRDQTATRQALGHLDQLLSRYPYSAEAQEAEKLWRDLRLRLADHVMRIGDYYLDEDEYQSAADRYRSVLNDYPGLGLDGQALYKLGVCYSRMRREDEATRIFEVILNNYEGTEYARAARDLVPAAN